MADANFQNFDRRMERILRQHERLSKGYVTAVSRDGLIVARPRRRLLSLFPWRATMFVLVAAMALKVLMYVQMGPAVYNERVQRLASGTQVEQVGAYLLSADAATVWTAEKIQGLAL